MKTKEEQNALKTMNEKLSALTVEELEQVTGGVIQEKQISENYCPSGVHELLDSPVAILEDNDIAKEATELAKEQILQQARQAMTPKENQPVVNVLALLQ